MTSKHTPGPWEAVPSIPNDGVECYWIRAKREFSPIARGFQVLDIGSVNGPQWREQKANARLIAKAPELVRALENLTNAAAATSGFASPMFLKDAQALLAEIDGE